MQQIDGKKVFENALIHHAINQPKIRRQKIRGVPNGGESYHIASLEVENLWIGYIYTHNLSKKDFNIEITARCQGFSTPDRFLKNNKLDLTLAPEQSDMLILKRTDYNCDLKMMSKIVSKKQQK